MSRDPAADPRPADSSPQRGVPVRALHVGRTAILLDSTTLAEATRHLGPTPITHEGDAGASLYSVCYRSRETTSPVVLRLESSVLGGTAHTITGFEMRQVDRGHRGIAGCSRIPVERADIRTDQGLYVGISTGALLSVMGRPQSLTDSVLTYEYTGTVQGSYRDPQSGRDTVVTFDVFAGIRATRVDSTIVGLQGWRTVTY